MTLKIVSGGQTGVDRGALDAALDLGLELGGYCPKGRKAEDGVIDTKYPLLEHQSAEYIDRTRANVIESDATLIIYFEELSGGTLATFEFCKEYDKAHLNIDANSTKLEDASVKLIQFIKNKSIKILNVAGPRASNNSQAYNYAKALIKLLYKAL